MLAKNTRSVKTMAEKEYIEREAAKKVLADDYAYAAAKLLDTVPTADVQEIVRCKDCNYFSQTTVNKKGFCICSVSGMEITDNDFCSYGENG